MQVKIGPSFFSKVKADYNDFNWAISREFLQNGIDSHSNCINVTVIKDGHDTKLVVENNGDPMNTDILINKLLALGESGKNFTEGTVGGFGRAKELCYFTNKSYIIRTGTMEVRGCGGDYELQENLPDFHGTMNEIIIEDDHVEQLIESFKKFARYSQWSGELKLNGKVLPTNLKKGAPRREFEFGTVYTNKSYSNRLIVRMNGIPMFDEWVGVDRCVILELKGTSQNCLTSNRDGLIGKFRSILSAFVTELSVDKKQALKNQATSYVRFAGVKYANYNSEDLKNLPKSMSDNQLISVTQEYGVNSAAKSNVSTKFDNVSIVSQQAKIEIGYEFILKSEIDIKIPDYFTPRGFSPYASKLVSIWSKLLIELHRLFKHSAAFSIGFVFSENEAEFDNNAKYGPIYFLNPVEIVQQKNSNSRSLKKRFSLIEKNRLLMIALHEYIHGIGNHYHDETYSTLLTDMAAKVFDSRKRFNHCFK